MDTYDNTLEMFNFLIDEGHARHMACDRFVTSLHNYFTSRGCLTQRQSNALQRLYDAAKAKEEAVVRTNSTYQIKKPIPGAGLEEEGHELSVFDELDWGYQTLKLTAILPQQIYFSGKDLGNLQVELNGVVSVMPLADIVKQDSSMFVDIKSLKPLVSELLSLRRNNTPTFIPGRLHRWGGAFVISYIVLGVLQGICEFIAGKV